MQDRFGTDVDASRVDFVYLRARELVEARHYPRVTMVGQSLGSVVLALEALLRFMPDTFIDTMGYAFAQPVFGVLGHARVGCYVHYPTISTDMLAKVRYIMH